jgi:hypothetical protein
MVNCDSDKKTRSFRDGDNVLTPFRINDGPLINVTDRARTILSEYVNYLEYQPNYVSTSNPPLFPKYRNLKAIERDLKKFSEHIGAQTIHKVGVKKHFTDLLDRGISEKESLKYAAKQFRMTERGVQQLLDNKIQIAGRLKPTERDIEINTLLKLFDDVVIANSEDKLDRHKIKLLYFVDNAKNLSTNERLIINKSIFINYKDRLIDILMRDKERINVEDKCDETLSARERTIISLKKLFNNS